MRPVGYLVHPLLAQVPLGFRACQFIDDGGHGPGGLSGGWQGGAPPPPGQLRKGDDVHRAAGELGLDLLEGVGRHQDLGEGLGLGSPS